MPPREVFGTPHGLLSSPDEWAGLAIGLVAVIVAVAHNARLDLRPLRRAGALGIGVALVASIAAPPAVTEEWHVPALVVLVVVAGVAYGRRQ